MTIVRQSGIIQWTEANILSVPEATGVYTLRNSAQTIIYVGRTREPRRLRERLLEHWRQKDIPEVAYFTWHQTRDEENARKTEDEWIKQYRPKYNVAQK